MIKLIAIVNLLGFMCVIISLTLRFTNYELMIMVSQYFIPVWLLQLFSLTLYSIVKEEKK